MYFFLGISVLQDAKRRTSGRITFAGVDQHLLLTRFKSDVATTHAKLASGWLARLYREGVEPSGSLQKVSDHPSSFSGLGLAQGKFQLVPTKLIEKAGLFCEEPEAGILHIRVCEG